MSTLEPDPHEKTDPGLTQRMPVPGDATVRMPAGPPPPPPAAGAALPPSPPAADATVRMPAGPPPPPPAAPDLPPSPAAAEATVRMPAGPPPPPVPVPPEIQPPSPMEATLPMKIAPAMPESRQPAPPRPSRAKYWVVGALALLILGGSLGYYLMYPSGEGPVALKIEGEEEVPPVLRPYLDKAGQGDPSAMRMLGTMYYNGLNVRQDRREGIRWYRKAAAAGSVAARKDLEQLGLAVDEK